MSCSTILIQGPWLSLKPKVADLNYRKQRRKVVVCCCPWSGSGMDKKKLAHNSTAEHDNSCNTTTTTTTTKNSGNSKNYFPFNFISYLLSLGPLSMIINNRRKQQKLPPTPSLLHLVGLSHYLVRPRPHHYPLTELANKYGPLVYLELGERSAVIISSAKIAKEVMRTHDSAFAGRPKILASQILIYNDRDVVFHQYDEYWKQMRNLCISKLLSSKRVGLFEHIRKEEGSALIASIETSCVPFNLSEKISLCTVTVLCRALFGRVGAVDMGEALVSIRKAMDLIGSISAIDLLPSIKALHFMSWHKVKLEKLRHQLDKILEGLIDIEHRSRDDEEHFVDVLLRLNESGVIDYDTVKSLLLDMIVAGTETSTSVADWAMAELMKNPDVMAKAQDEIRQAFKGKKTIQECEIDRLKYLKLVIMETLRLHPPLSITLRSCREEAEVDGYHIPLNTVVVINIWAIGRDPTYWKNPESFEPERFDANPVNFSGTHFEFIPFGSGKRMCPGKAFGLAQIEFILAQLLYHFDWELPGGICPDDLDMTDVGGFAISRKTPLHLIAKPYYISC